MPKTTGHAESEHTLNRLNADRIGGAADASRTGADLRQDTGQVYSARRLGSCADWSAHDSQPILAAFTASDRDSLHVFTASVTHTPVRWWLVQQHTSSAATAETPVSHQPILLAELKIPMGRGMQIGALSVCLKQGLLVCGNSVGDVLGFAVPPEVLQAQFTGTQI